jgi:hypothetical protein
VRRVRAARGRATARQAQTNLKAIARRERARATAPDAHGATHPSVRAPALARRNGGAGRRRAVDARRDDDATEEAKELRDALLRVHAGRRHAHASSGVAGDGNAIAACRAVLLLAHALILIGVERERKRDLNKQN